MHYRPYGRSGELVSEIGLGGHREGVETREGLARAARFHRHAQERARVVGRAIDAGVTYFDSTFGCEIASLGESLRLLGRRDQLFISGMRVDFFGLLRQEDASPAAYTRRELESRLRESGLDYLDQMVCGAMEQGDPLAHPGMMDEVFATADALRSEGKLRHIAFSCHDPNYAARLLRRWPFEAVMCPYNFVNRTAEGDLAAAVQETGAAWVAMKTMVWRFYGIPTSVLRRLRPVPGQFEFDPAAPIGTLAHRFVLDQPLLTTCVPAANASEAVDENVAASGRGPLTAAETAELERWAAASVAYDHTALALGGLLEDNLRVRFFALGVAGQRLGLELPRVNPDADDAEAQAATAAQQALAAARAQAPWQAILPAASDVPAT